METLNNNKNKDEAHEALINTFIDLLKEMGDTPQVYDVKKDKEENPDPEKKDKPK